MKFVLYLAFLGLVSSDKILDFVSKNHIMQARCRLQHCEPGTAASSKCWQDCSRSFLSQKAKGHIIKEQKSPINISLAFKGCNIVEWHRLFPYSKAIYQVYTQDHQNAWHDEGQTFENWIKLSPLTQTRTEAVKVLIISSQDKVHSSRMVRKLAAVAKCSRQESEATKAVSEVEKVRSTSQPRPRPPFPPSSLQAQKKQQENEATASGTGRRPASTKQSYNHLALGAVLGAVLCVLLGAGVAILCMVRCLPKKS